MDFFGKDKLSRLDEERQRRRQQRAEEALRRLEEVGKQTQQLVANHTTATQTSAPSQATDASGRRPGALSRVLFEQATGNGRGERRKNKLDPMGLLSEGQKALAQIDGAMGTIKNAVADATGAGLRGGLEEASKSVTDVVDRVAAMANGTVGTLSPSANKNPLAELMAEEQADENKQRHEAGDDEKEDHRSKLNLENKLDTIKALAEKATGLDLGEKRGGDDDEGSFQFQAQLQGVLPHEAMNAVMSGASVNLREIAANAASHVIAKGDHGNGIMSTAGEAVGDLIRGEDAKTIAANAAGNFGGDKIAGLIGGKLGDAVGGAAGSAISSAVSGEKFDFKEMIEGAATGMIPGPFGGVVDMAMGAVDAVKDGKAGRVGEVISNAASIFDPSNVANVAINAATMSPQNLLSNITQGLDPAGIVANVTEKVASFDANAMLSNIGSALEPANFAKMAGVAGGALTNLPGTFVGIAGQAFENVTARLKDAADLLNPSVLPKGESPNDHASGLATGKRAHEPLTPTPEHAAGDPSKQIAQVTVDPNAAGGQSPNAAMMQTQGMPPAGPTKPQQQPGDQKADPNKPAPEAPSEAAKNAKDGKAPEKTEASKEAKVDPKDAAHSAKDAKAVDEKGAGQKKPADDPKAHKQAETAGKATDGPAKSADPHAAKGAVAATAHAGTATAAGHAGAKGEGAAAATANQQQGHAAPQKQPAPNPQGAPQSNRPAAERHQAAQPTKTANTANRNAAPTSSASGGAQQINPQPVNSPPSREVPQNEKVVTQPNVTIEAKGESGALPGMPADLATQTPPAAPGAAGTPAQQATPAPTSSATPTPKTVAPLPTVTPTPAPAAKQNPPTSVTMPQAKGQPMSGGGAPAATGATPQPKASSGASQAGAQSVPSNAKAAPPPPAAKIPEQKATPGTAAPQTPSTQAPEPNIPPVRAPGGDGAPNPSGMVPQTANLSADRSNAQQQLTAEAQTQSKVGPEANTLKQSQVASQKPAFEQTKRSGDAPRQQAVTASTAQGQQAGQAGHQRGQQSAAAGNQQIQGQGQQAAGERGQLQGVASANSAAVVQQTSPSVMQGAAAPAQAAVQSAATAGRAQQVIVNPAAVARAGQAGATNAQLPPFDGQRFNSIDQQLAQPMPETNMAQADQGKQAADQTYQQANQQIEQLANIQPPAINAPQSAGAGTMTKDGHPTRESAIANVEQQVTAQAQAQGPAKMQEAARPLQQEVKQHATSAQQAATTSAESQLQQQKAKEQQIKQQPPPTTGAQAAAQAQPQYQAHQAEATQASTQMKSEIAAAQTAANTGAQQAKATRDQSITQAQANYQQQSTAAQGQYSSAQQAAKGQFDSQNQAAQSAMANEQQQAQQAATQQTQAAQQKADADISQQNAQLNSQQQQANASHQQQMEAANQQHDAQVQAAQAQMDADVSSQQSQMQSQVSAEQSRGQQEVNQHLTEGEQSYQREIQQGEQQAQAEKARAEAEAAEKERQAQAEKDKNSGGVFGKVVGWVKDRFNDMMNAVKAVLAAARDLIVSIMEKARQLAIAALNKARQLALAALAKVKSAIQGIISACASAIRSIISACASLVRNLIQNLANMLKSLVQALTTLLQTLVQAFQAAVNALLDGLIAAVSLINKDLGDKLRSATQKYRDAFNNAMNNLQQGIKAAGDALQAKIQQAADGAIAVVNAAEQTLNAAVTRVEQTLNAAVEVAYQVGAAAINKAFDAAEAVVNKAFEVAEAAVKAYFDAQIAALDLVQQGVNAVADFVIAVADKVLEAVAKIAEAIVNMIPESWTKWFVDFWNGPWRQAIIIGLATVAAVAITVATCGAAGPVAMILVAGLIGGTIAGTAYAGGELLAREGAIHLTEEHPGEGVYVPGIGYQQVKIGPDGKPVMPEGLTPEQQAAWEKNSQWALSNFNTQRDAEGNVTGYDRKSGSEIANYAVQEGMKGFGEGFISAAGAMGGSLAGGAVAGLGIVGRVASNPIARQMIATAVEGGVGVVSQSVGAGWTAGFDAMAEGKSPGEAFSAAWKAGSEQITDPGNWVAAMASVGVVPLKTKALGPLMDRATGRIANQAVGTAIKEGTDVVVDTMAETVGNAGGAFVSTYYKAIQEGKTPAEAMSAAQSAASDSFKPEAIAQSLLMNTAGNISNKGAERYAARRAAQTGSTPDAPHTTPHDTTPEPAATKPVSNDPAVGNSDGRHPSDRPTQPNGEPTPDGNPRTTRGGDESNPTPRVAPSESTEAQRNKPAAGEDPAPPVKHTDEQKQEAATQREAGPIRERKDAPPKRTDTDQPVDTTQDQALRGQDGQPVHADDTAQQQQTATQKPKETNEPQRFQDRQTDQARIDQQMADKGHSGIEVHSHFMGNVDPSSFASTIARSGDAPMLPRNPDADTASGRMGDHSPYEPVMREIAKLNDFRHTTTTNEAGDTVITTRGRSGDALMQIDAAQQRIETLKSKLEREGDTMSPDARKRIETEIHDEARSAVEKALRASDETDFNSSYEVRDELVKKFYGAAERNDILAAKGVDPKNARMTDPKVAEAYTEHFQGRPDVLERIPLAAEAQRRLDAGDFKDNKERAALQKQADAVKEQMAYDAYAKDTILRLAQDGITYTEQSNSINKIGARFDEAQIGWLKNQLIAEHANDPKMVQALQNLTIKHVTMINTNQFGVRGDQHRGADAQIKTDDLHKAAGTVRPSDADFSDSVKQLVEQTRRGDVVGVDIAGAEHFTFDREGQRRMTELYDALLTEAQQPGGNKPIVLRPHVGEGANDVVPGQVGHRDANRQIVDGPDGPELSHYARAKENLDNMLKVFEEIAARPENGGKLPPDVIVRFGHATHTTPEMAARMAKLGIIAEVNLTSNIETGSVSQKPPADLAGGQDNTHAPKPDDQRPRYEQDQSKRGGTLDDHALATLIAADAPVILSTDAHSVMSTNMANEYNRAKAVIDEVRSGQRKVPIDQSVVDPSLPPGTSKLYSYDEMPQHLKDRFDRAERKLYEDANRYFDMRPKQGGDGTQTTTDPAPGKPIDPDLKQRVDSLREGESIDLGKRGGKDGLIEHLRNQNVEFGVFRDAEGNWYVIKGDQDSLTPRNPTDRLVAHNHPGGTKRLSPDDLDYMHSSTDGKQKSTLLMTPGDEGGVSRERVSDYEPTKRQQTDGDAPIRERQDQPAALRKPRDEAEAEAQKQVTQSTDLLRQKFGDRLADFDTTLTPAPDGKRVLQQSPTDALIGLPADVIPATLSGADALAKLQAEGIPRWGGLTSKERGHESAFADHLEQNMPAAIAEYTKRSFDEKVGTYIFEVDAAKKLYEAYGAGKGPANPDQLDVRATANHAMHPAAVAVARVAFLSQLDTMANLPDGDPRKSIFVTNGGCAAGKGSLSEIVKDQNGGQFKFGAVWDAAGEGDAQENAWILQAARQRGLKVTYGFVENDPMFTYNAVLERADMSGRIVDPLTFSRSYARGQENMRAFLDSPEYKASVAAGDASTIGVYTGKFDTKTMSYPDSRLLGDNGKIGVEHMPAALDESAVTTKAIEIFDQFLAKRTAEGKPTDHWFEGGAVNPLKFGEQPQQQQSKADVTQQQPPAPAAATMPHLSPNRPKDVPTTVPATRDEIRGFVRDRYKDVVGPQEAHPKRASPEYQGLIDELSTFKPGELGKPENKEKAKELLGRWTEISKTIEGGPDESGLRDLYNRVEKGDMVQWMEQIAHLPKQQQAELAHMYREELKRYVREMMTDTKSVEVLNLRDRAVYGSEKGPSFDSLFQKALKKHNGNVDLAYDEIVGSSQRSNKDVNKAITGSETGLKPPTEDGKGPIRERADAPQKREHRPFDEAEQKWITELTQHNLDAYKHMKEAGLPFADQSAITPTMDPAEARRMIETMVGTDVVDGHRVPPGFQYQRAAGKLYRADNRPIEVVFAQGFQAQGTHNSVGAHIAGIDGQYVSFTKRQQFAHDWHESGSASVAPDMITGPQNGGVYVVRGEGIDIDRGVANAESTKQQRNYVLQSEVAIDKGVAPSDVLGAYVVDPSAPGGHRFIPNPAAGGADPDATPGLKPVGNFLPEGLDRQAGEHALKGDLALSRNDYDAAEASYKQVLELDPNNMRAVWGMERIAAARENREPRMEVWSEASSAGTDKIMAGIGESAPTPKEISPLLRTKIEGLKPGESVDLGRRGGKDGLVEYLRNQPVEYGVFRDKDGNYYVMMGTVDSLSPRSNTDRLIAHNHPGGTPRLSPDDVEYIHTSSEGKQRATLLLTPGEEGGVKRHYVSDYERITPDADETKGPIREVKPDGADRPPSEHSLESVLTKSGKKLEDYKTASKWELESLATQLLAAKGIKEPSASQKVETLFQLDKAIKKGDTTFEAPFEAGAIKKEDGVNERLGNIFGEKRVFDQSELQADRLKMSESERQALMGGFESGVAGQVRAATFINARHRSEGDFSHAYGADGWKNFLKAETYLNNIPKGSFIDGLSIEVMTEVNRLIHTPDTGMKAQMLRTIAMIGRGFKWDHGGEVRSGKQYARPEHYSAAEIDNLHEAGVRTKEFPFGMGTQLQYPDPGEVRPRMNKLIADLKAELAKPNGDPIAAAAEFQRHFVALHPFGDSNGRTSRALMNRILLEFDLPPAIFADQNRDMSMSPAEWRDEVAKGVARSKEYLGKSGRNSKDDYVGRITGAGMTTTSPNKPITVDGLPFDLGADGFLYDPNGRPYMAKDGELIPMAQLEHYMMSRRIASAGKDEAPNLLASTNEGTRQFYEKIAADPDAAKGVTVRDDTRARTADQEYRLNPDPEVAQMLAKLTDPDALNAKMFQFRNGGTGSGTATSAVMSKYTQIDLEFWYIEKGLRDSKQPEMIEQLRANRAKLFELAKAELAKSKDPSRVSPENPEGFRYKYEKMMYDVSPLRFASFDEAIAELGDKRMTVWRGDYSFSKLIGMAPNNDVRQPDAKAVSDDRAKKSQITDVYDDLIKLEGSAVGRQYICTTSDLALLKGAFANNQKSQTVSLSAVPAPIRERLLGWMAPDFPPGTSDADKTKAYEEAKARKEKIVATPDGGKEIRDAFGIPGTILKIKVLDAKAGTVSVEAVRKAFRIDLDKEAFLPGIYSLGGPSFENEQELHGLETVRPWKIKEAHEASTLKEEFPVTTSTTTPAPPQPSDGGGVGFASGEDALGIGEGAAGTPPLPSTDAAPAATGAQVTVETEWDAADGSGRTRDNVGVGERVFLTADAEGAWTATTGTRRGTGQQFIWTAPGTAGAATITFTPAGGGTAVTKTLTVVAPTSIRMTKVSDDTFGSGTVGAGFVANVTFHPLNVSFAATQWKEDTGQRGTAATGVFVAQRGRRAITLPTHNANPNWLGIGAGNSGPTDHAAFSFTGGNFSQGGSFQWSIAQRWKLRSAQAAGGLIETLDQTCVVEGDPHAGRTTVAKGGASSTRSPDGTGGGGGGESEGRGNGYANDGPPTSWSAVGEGLSTDGAKETNESLGHEVGGRGEARAYGVGGPGDLPTTQPARQLIYLRKRGEVPNRKKAERVSIGAQVGDMHVVERALLRAFGVPEDRLVEFDTLPIEADPVGTTGITKADLQGSGGVVTILVSPKLADFLRETAARLNAKGPTQGTQQPTTTPPPPPPAPTGRQGGGQPDKQQTGGTTSTPPSTGGKPDGDNVRIPDRLKSLFPKPPVIVSLSDRAAFQKAVDLLDAMTDQDITNFSLIVTSFTYNSAKFLAAVEMYKKMKEQYQQVLEQALVDAAKDQGAPSADHDTDDGPIDPARFRRMSTADKEKYARERMTRLRNKQLKEMAKNPGKTMKELAKGAVRPDLQLDDINKSMQELSEMKGGGYEKLAKSTGTASKMSGFFAGMLALLAVVAMFTPGVNVMVIMQASFAMMMTSAVLSIAEAELYVKAAGEATTPAKLDEMIQGGAQAQLRSFMAIAGMATAVAGGLIAKIPLSKRIGTVGDALSVARAQLAKNIGDAWKGARTKLVTDLRASMAGLRDMLKAESRTVLDLKKRLDGMTAADFYEKILEDKWLRAQVNLTEESAKRLSDLSKTPQGKGPTTEVFEEMRSSLGEGQKLADRQLDAVITKVENQAKALEAATTKDEFHNALNDASSTIEQEPLARQMMDESAKTTAAKLEDLAKKHPVAQPTKPKATTEPETTTEPKATEAKPPQPTTPKEKAWDDPALTEAEFIAQYHKRYPNPKQRLSDAQLKARFKDGKRLNPATGELKKPDKKRNTFEESKGTMAEKERQRREGAAADAKPVSSAFDGAVDALGLTQAEAGMLKKWSRAVAALDALKKVDFTTLLKGIKKGFSQTLYDAFRHRLFDQIIDVVLGRSGGKITKSPKEQATALKQFMGEGLDVMPDSASKGSLYSKYRAARFADPQGDVHTLSTSSKTFEPPPGVKIQKTVRQADGSMQVKGQKANGGPDDGPYAIDDKAGGSRDMKQLEDVSAMMTSDGIKFVGSDAKMKGVIYWCEDQANAATLAAKISKLSEKMHVAYIHEETGLIVWVR